MLLKSQPANPVSAEGGEGQDETYYTDLLKMQLNNTVWVDPASLWGQKSVLTN